MYEQHFGLRADPFGAAPDPRFLYFSREHAQALAALHYGLMQRRGLLVLTSPPGMGKTTLLHHLAEKWNSKAEVAFISRPPETRDEMIAAVLTDLGAEPGETYAESCLRLRDQAVEARRRGKWLLLIFDEAQGIPAEVLEEIRRLTNLDTPAEKLVQVVLAGHPKLSDRWAGPEGEALRQRVGVAAEIRALDAAEVARYVEYRVRAAGQRRRLFTRGALRALAERSAGVPRNINQVCFAALSAAFARGRKQVGEAELQPEEQTRGRMRRAAAGALGAAAGVVLAGYWLWGWHRFAREAPPAWPVRAVRAAAPASPVVSPAEAPAMNTERDATSRGAAGTSPSATLHVQVRQGETMRRIALRTYGRWDAEVWERVRKHNPQLTSPERLRAGQVLLLPEGGSR